MARAGVERRDPGVAETTGVRTRRLPDGLLLRIAYDGRNAGCRPLHHAGNGSGHGIDLRAGLTDHEGLRQPGRVLMPEANRQAVLRFENVTVSFDGDVALRDISFEAFESEARIILGAAGSGKTVLLKTAMGLVKPESG